MLGDLSKGHKLETKTEQQSFLRVTHRLRYHEQ